MPITRAKRRAEATEPFPPELSAPLDIAAYSLPGESADQTAARWIFDRKMHLRLYPDTAITPVDFICQNHIARRRAHGLPDFAFQSADDNAT